MKCIAEGGIIYAVTGDNDRQVRVARVYPTVSDYEARAKAVAEFLSSNDSPPEDEADEAETDTISVESEQENNLDKDEA